mgnify:CR=1 FL=1
MQDEVNDKTVARVVRASKFTANTLYKATKAYVDHQIKKEAQFKAHLKAKKEMKAPSAQKHGKVKVSKLIGENAGAATIDVSEKIRTFEHIARKYNVDYAVKKDKTVDPPKYVIFFKARDTDAISQAFKEYVHKCEKEKEKPSLKKRLDKKKEIARKRATKQLDKDKHREQERSL